MSSSRSSSSWKTLGLLAFTLAMGSVEAAPSTDQDRLKAQLADRAALFFADSPAGGVVLVRRGDDILLRQAYGMADVEHQLPMQVDSVLRLASISKQFTAMAILKLVDAGKLQLDQALGSIDPALPAAWHPLTIRHLLTHTSGIPNISRIAQSRADRRNEASAESLLKFFQDLPLEFAAGSRFSYSNSNYILLTRLIEKLSGSSYPDYLQQTLFGPLEMQQTRYGSHLALIPGRAQGYQKGENGELLNADFISMSQPQGAGGLVSTVDDLARWDRALQRGALVSPELLKQAFSKVQLSDGSSMPYGFGWMLAEVEGEPSQEHSGFINGFNSQLLRLPEQEILVTVLSNAEYLDPAVLTVELAAAALNKPIDRTPAKQPLNTRWLGKYQFADASSCSAVQLESTLQWQCADADPVTLFGSRSGRWYLGAGVDYLKFQDDAGRVSVQWHDRVMGDKLGQR